MSSYSRNVTGEQLSAFGLTHQEQVFVCEYIKDLNQRRAAKASMFPVSECNDLLERPSIKAALEHVITLKMEDAGIDAAWLLTELRDNHYLARQEGKLSASNQALALIGRHAKVDAFAAEKVVFDADAAVLERLARGRARNAQRDDDPPDDVLSTINVDFM